MARTPSSDGEPAWAGRQAFGQADYHARLARAIVREAQALGVRPQHLAMVIHYETGGSWDPWKAGPTTRWGQHRGLIQWGVPQRQRYGVGPGMPVEAQMQAVGRYLRAAGVRPGMGLVDLYSAVNAGRVGRHGASDGYGTVASHAQRMAARSSAAADRLLGLAGAAPVATATAGSGRVQVASAAPGLGTGSGSRPGGVVAVGDSISVGMRWHADVDNRLPVPATHAGRMQLSREHGGGRDPSWITRYIRTTYAPGSLTGRTVVLSTGASNDPSQVARAVPQQLQALRAAGAGEIVILGVGPKVGAQVNATLATLARQNGAHFQPLVGAIPDGVHPQNPRLTLAAAAGRANAGSSGPGAAARAGGAPAGRYGVLAPASAGKRAAGSARSRGHGDRAAPASARSDDRRGVTARRQRRRRQARYRVRGIHPAVRRRQRMRARQAKIAWRRVRLLDRPALGHGALGPGGQTTRRRVRAATFG